MADIERRGDWVLIDPEYEVWVRASAVACIEPARSPREAERGWRSVVYVIGTNNYAGGGRGTPYTLDELMAALP